MLVAAGANELPALTVRVGWAAAGPLAAWD